MCFHDAKLAVATLTYDFSYDLTEVFPYPGGGTRTDTFSSSINFTMTRVMLADKGLPPALESTFGLDTFLSPGEFFLLSDCCCPCNWTFIPKFDTPLSSVATQTRAVVFLIHPPPDISGTVTFDGNIDFGLLPNVAQYPILCGQNVTFDPQSTYWPTFDGVTPLDPAIFTGGNGVNWVVSAYTGAPALDPGVGTPYDGGSIVSPFDTAAGYFLFYDNTSGFPPTPVPGVTGSGNGFRNPCDTSMNFNQTVSWTMTAVNGAGDTVNGTGTASITISFNP